MEDWRDVIRAIQRDQESEYSEFDELKQSSVWDQFAQAPAVMPPTQFQSDHFEIGQQIGKGGMGTVYQGIDRSNGRRVAVKVLRRLEADAILRFKQEFRLVQGLYHPNLVKLGELFEENGFWLFSMELIEGQDFLTYVCSQETEGKEFSETRLVAALIQLAQGLCVLHKADIVHRDIKPSNVLVSSAEQRVVLLDFGLVERVGQAPIRYLESGSSDKLDSSKRPIAGTPAFMSPEQAAGHPIDPKTDCYAVGLMLYTALTGQTPFGGDRETTLQARQQFEPPQPKTLNAAIPDNLNDLCVQLLRREPERRPSAEEVLQRLGAHSGSTTIVSGLPPPWVGRARELSELTTIGQHWLSGRPQMVAIHGISGVGKSRLAEHFLSGQEPNNPLLLRGRCYERESVPFKALDSLIDQLSRYWSDLETAQAQALLPDDARALARLFPVLDQVAVIRRAPELPSSLSPVELQDRAARSLGQVLQRLQQEQPLVLYLDDLQWGDTDSFQLLLQAVGSASLSRFLLLACSREAATFDPLCQGLRSVLDCQELALDTLSSQETQQLASALMEVSDGHRQGLQTIARESGGLPLFVTELARYTRGEEPITVQQLFERRVETLAKDTRAVLECIAVAGRPLPQIIFHVVPGVVDLNDCLDQLRALQLVQSRGLRQTDTVDVIHDRFREVVLQQLDEQQRRGNHLLLAECLAKGDTDPEYVAEHFESAQRPEQAQKFVEMAAERAARALAFSRAARLYAKARQALAPHQPQWRALTRQLADTLVNAGRGAEAAEVYLQAAEHDQVESIGLRRRAAEQLLCAGMVDEGLKVMGLVLAQTGIRLPKSPVGALLSLVYNRAHLTLRGLKYKPRQESAVAPQKLQKIDATWAVATGLSKVDMIRGTDFATRCLLLSLAAGEPFRVARGLALEACNQAFEGQGAAKRVAQLVELSTRIATEIASPHALGLATMASGVSSLVLGRWQEAFDHCERAHVIFQEQCVGAAWETCTNDAFALVALEYMGRWSELLVRSVEQYKDAKRRQDRYTAADMVVYKSYHHLAQDQPEKAWETIEDVKQNFTQQGFLVQHYLALLASTQTDLYQGNYQRAWSRFNQNWGLLRRSLIFRASLLRAEAVDTRGKVALALASVSQPSDRKTLIKIAGQSIALLRKEKMDWCRALALLLEARVTSLLKGESEAQSAFSNAAQAFAKAGMSLHCAVANYRAGELNNQLEEPTQFFKKLQMQRPERFVRMYGGQPLQHLLQP